MDTVGPVLLLVEAKKYRPDFPVGVDIVRSLHDVKIRNKATTAMRATTWYVTRYAK